MSLQALNELQEVNEELATMQTEWREAAANHAILKRQYEYAFAVALVKASGNNADKQKANALIAVVGEYGEIWDSLKENEGTLAGCQALWRALDRRASNAQSILKAETQEGFRPDLPQPAWTNHD